MYQMQRVESGTRSTLYYNPSDRLLVRHYHDTDRVSDPFAPIFDDHGVPRCSGNRRIDDLVLRNNTEERTYGRSERPVPTHIRNTLRVICRQQFPTVATVARELSVKPSTVWSYASHVVETWPESVHDVARLIDPTVYRAVMDCENVTGSLRDVHARIRHDVALGDEDVLAHIRLARMCRSVRSNF